MKTWALMFLLQESNSDPWLVTRPHELLHSGGLQEKLQQKTKAGFVSGIIMG